MTSTMHSKNRFIPSRTCTLALLIASASGTTLGQDRVSTYWNGATSGMFEDESLWSFNNRDFKLFGDQSPAGGDIWLSFDVDYELYIEDDGSSPQIRTAIEELLITEDGLIAGYNFRMVPFVQSGTNGSFVNYGTIRGDGGDVRISGTTNYGTIHANGGEVSTGNNNFGTYLVTAGAHLKQASGGSNSQFYNAGLIDVRGVGAIFQVDTQYLRGELERRDQWANYGTLRITDSGTARLGRMVLSDLGTVERDASSRIEITGLFDLEGQTINASTFAGDLWIGDGYPNISGPDRGELTNGTIDLTGNWLHFGNRAGYITQSTIIGGDIILDPTIHGEEYSALVIDDIDIRDGGIIMTENSLLTFGEQTVENQQYNYDQYITTLHNSGTQSDVSISTGDLILGEESFISGHMRLGIGFNSNRRIINHGTILSTALSGRLDLYAQTVNHGLIKFQDNEMISNASVENKDDLIFDNSAIRLFSIDNYSNLEIINGSTLSLTRDLVLMQDSVLSIDATAGEVSISTQRDLYIDGVLNLDLSLVTEAGFYTLFQSVNAYGDFDTINIIGLQEGLVFDFLSPQSGLYKVSAIPAPTTIACLGLGLLAAGRRRQ